MIELRDLSFSYHGGPPVLQHLDFRGGDGQLIAVLGPNGVGKSTLFKCILGFYRDYGGEILFNGREVRTLSRRELASEVAYIPQSGEPVFNYTVEDTVLMGTTASLHALRSPGQQQKQAVEKALELLHIGHLRYRGIGQISGGERQLVLIARAMVQRARLIVMDEPTANLDFGNQYLVLRTIRELTEQGYSILMSTHNPDHALRFSTHVLAMKKDGTYVTGPSLQVLDEALISGIYGLQVKLGEMEGPEGPVRYCIPV